MIVLTVPASLVVADFATATRDWWTHSAIVISLHELDVALTIMLTLFIVWVWGEVWYVIIQFIHLARAHRNGLDQTLVCMM